MTSFAIVKIRSSIRSKPEARETMKLLRLHRVNHCVVIPDNVYYRGMLKQVKDYVTWGEVDPDTLETLLKTRGGITDEQVKAATKLPDLHAFAQAVSAGKAALKDVPECEKVFRLHPPRKGHGGIKRPAKLGGALGYRGKEINALIMRMLPEA